MKKAAWLGDWVMTILSANEELLERGSEPSGEIESSSIQIPAFALARLAKPCSVCVRLGLRFLFNAVEVDLICSTLRPLVFQTSAICVLCYSQFCATVIEGPRHVARRCYESSRAALILAMAFATTFDSRDSRPRGSSSRDVFYL